MDTHSFSSQVEVLSVTDSGRRRRWSAAEKIRIVEESLSRPRSVALTARRHDISRSLLTRWRKDYREGLLGIEPAPTFAPVMIAAEPAPVAASPAAELESCQRRSKIGPRGGAKLGHFGFAGDARGGRRPVIRALHVAGG